MIELAELMMILDLHREGLSVSAISRACGIDRKTIRKYIERGMEAPAYTPRPPRATVIDPYAEFLRQRVTAYPGLTAQRLFRELKALGYPGGVRDRRWELLSRRRLPVDAHEGRTCRFQQRDPTELPLSI